MKKLILSSILAMACSIGYSQITTNNGIFADVGDIAKRLVDMAPSNLCVAPYATYAMGPHKVGYGVAAVYNVDKFVGIFTAVDHIDTFLAFNGGVQFQLPIHPFSKFPTFALTPFTINAFGSPVSGAKKDNGGLQTANSGGLGISIGHVFGGTFTTGAAYGTRTGAGSYGGGYINVFGGWKIGF